MTSSFSVMMEISGVRYNSKRMSTSSAIDGVSVPEVRRALQCLRQAWKDRSPDAPFFASDVMPGFTYHNGELSFEEFALLHEQGKHYKRHTKGRSRT